MRWWPGMLDVKQVARSALAAVRIGGAAGVTAGALVAAVAQGQWLDQQRLTTVHRRYTRRWAGWVPRWFGLATVIDGRVPTPRPGRGLLVIANHRSAMDIPLLMGVFAGAKILSRADLSGWPVIGPAAERAGTLFVQRNDKGSRQAALRRIQSELAGGSTVVVFSEGGAFAGDEVRPFQPGLFVGVQEMPVDIVPVGLAYPAGTEFTEASFAAHLWHVGRRVSMPVAISVGSLLARGIDGRATARLAQDAVQTLVVRARALLDADAAAG